METKDVICYDIVLKPKQIELEKLLWIMKESNFLFYDSYESITNGYESKPPYMLDGSDMTKVLIDVSTSEGKEIYERVIKELKVK
jgi:hypothetical protein